MINEKQNPTPLTALLDERAAAKFLGISPRRLWSLADAGEIPFIRIGPRLKRYTNQDLQDFVERNRRVQQSACGLASSEKQLGQHHHREPFYGDA
jgi:excisionase family DNA binding protein